MDKNLKREERVGIMQTLYRYDLEECFKTVESEEYTDFQVEVINYVVLNLKAIDEIISKSLTNYTIARLSYVDRAICRMVIAELKNGLAPAIAINEGLEIVKAYSDQGDNKNVRFMNKLLDSIKNNL